MLPVASGLPDVISQRDVSGWDVLISIAIMLAAWLVANLAGRAIRRLLRRTEGTSAELRAIIVRSVRYGVLLLGLGVALSVLGAQLQPLLVAVLIVFVVLLFVLRGIADNFGAGIVLQTRRPIHLTDEIEALGHVGVVTDMNSRAVVIRTYDGREVHLPNRQLLDSALTNHSALGGRRSEVQVRVRTSDRALVAATLDVARAVPGVLAEPAPDLVILGIEPDRITAVLRCWHAPGQGPQVTSAVVEALAAELAVRGVEAAISTPPPTPPGAPAGAF